MASTPAKATVKVRRLQPEDIPTVVECIRAAYPAHPEQAAALTRTLSMQRDAFGDGQHVALRGKRIVGYSAALIVQLDGVAHEYTYREFTGAGSFSTHDPGGDTLFGADLAVHPDFRGQGVATALYGARRKLLRRYNLRRMLGMGRIPGFAEWQGRLTAKEYVDKVVAGELRDPALGANLKAGYRVTGLRLDVMPETSSLEYCTLLEYDNPDFDLKKRRIAASPISRPIRKVRVCAAQWRMRARQTVSDFEGTLRFFAESANDYSCHFLVLPEYFVVQRFTAFAENLKSTEMMARLADEVDTYRELLKGLARDLDLYIIGGSHPVRREGRLYNVAHLFTPSGGIYEQDKLHITPVERELWGIHPGTGLRVFDTPLCRLAILVCYDVEFPELPRLQALAGAQILFVPFSTDEKQAYMRVRHTAQARAVENSLYVVLAGNVGNLPQRSYMLNYARSAVLTPSDFGFPDSGVAGQADPNVETVVTADLDLSTLAQHRDMGSVRVLHDRRPDLYDLRALTEVEVVSVE